MQYYFGDSTTSKNIDLLVQEYNHDEFLSPFRSTVNLLSYIQSKSFELFLNNIIIGNNSELHFEYQVNVQKGKGIPSHTDLMIINDRQLILIEAKNTEPKYEKVSHWNNSNNKEQVLLGWIGLIEEKTGLKLAIKNIENITYQMIHRLASSCIDHAKLPTMYYFYFGTESSMEAYYKEQLDELSNLINKKIPIYFKRIEYTKTDLQMDLEKEWGQGNRDLREKVINGICSNNLYRFKS